MTDLKKTDLKIEKVHVHFCWEWDIFNNDCAICRSSICDNMGQNDAEDGSVVGVCGHAFHYACISSWLTSKRVCPLCNKPWKYNKK